MRLKNISQLKRAAVMIMFAAVIVIFGNATSFAQDHSQRQERHVLKDHQRAERNYDNGYGARDHRRQERRELKYEQRNERRVYNNGGYNNNGGYYGNGGGYNNGGYDPYYNNRGYNNGGYNNNRGYNHRDSRNPVKRGIHHVFGGH